MNDRKTAAHGNVSSSAHEAYARKLARERGITDPEMIQAITQATHALSVIRLNLDLARFVTTQGHEREFTEFLAEQYPTGELCGSCEARHPISEIRVRGALRSLVTILERQLRDL